MHDPAAPDHRRPWQRKLHTVIFEADTPGGKAFDVALLVAILASVVAAMIDSVPTLAADEHDALVLTDWVFTVLFTVEYVLRLLCVRRRAGYVFSFFGLIDLASIVPTYLTLFAFGYHGGAVIRTLRLLRVFRIFKLAQFLGEATTLRRSLAASRAKVIVFLTFVLIMVCILGSTMYVVEGPEHGFTSIPEGIYWAVVTVTTVGYGDISPVTPLGKVIAAVAMVLGYSVLVIPGGIISAEWAAQQKLDISTQSCPDCSAEGHDVDARFCNMCGARL